MPVPASEQLAQWRRIQSAGQLLVALGALTAFISLRNQLPLFEEQAKVMQKLQRKVEELAEDRL